MQDENGSGVFELGNKGEAAKAQICAENNVADMRP